MYDGPGLRTSVFFKGCPLRCSWCHNPEGQSAFSEIVRSPNGCIECGSCISLTEVVDGRTVFTEEAIRKCPMNLLRVCGEDIDARALADKVLKNAYILNMNGGGVTFSGGEPLMQTDFLLECLEYLSGKVHRAVQTCGYASREKFLSVLDACDYVLYDLKLIDDEEHKLHTGVANKIILENFSSLRLSGKDFVVRVPLIPTLTDSERNMELLCKLLSDSGVYYAELLPYNKMAGGKYKMLMREYTPTFDDSADCVVRDEILSDYKIKYKIL